ncbi:MAG: hypothetical protein SFT92_05090 [Rickettsiales bacterium]|nr:hypothetical protein [Rickettsiales bacterium]
MSLYSNKLPLLALCLWLSACGFKPLYDQEQRNAKDHSAFAGVLVENIPERSGQLLKADLEDRLNPDGVVPPHPAFRLVASLAANEAAIDVARDGTVSRTNLYLNSTYSLFRTSDGVKVTSGTIRHVSSFNNNVVNAYFSTYVSREDAIQRSIHELSEKYRQRLSAYLAGPDSGKPDDTVNKQKQENENGDGPYPFIPSIQNPTADPNMPYNPFINR